jgi:2-oxoglutarate/2-oxoacid ferredoxin oxidoreductase subunit alpha
MKEYSILIGGAAGEGSKKSGLIISKLFSHYGYNIYIYEDYQSIIKGGHNFSIIRASKDKVYSSSESVDFVLALNKETAEKHVKKIKDKDNLIYNSDLFSVPRGRGVPIEEITRQVKGLPIMKNTALVSAFAKIVGIEWKTVEKVLKKELPISTETNLRIARKAYGLFDSKLEVKKISSDKKIVISGNEAIALGALKAGLEAYVAYPMTPTTGILNYLSSVSKEFKLIVNQPENEIAVINESIGLSFSGKKTMIGTSGGGFALMNEGISLSAESEVPLVIVNGQRMGPSTGVPTYNGQSDLLYSIFAGHGDFEKIVVAPGDAEESFTLSGLALNFSWKYQIPSIILSDKEVSESSYSLDVSFLDSVKEEKPILWNNKNEYLRYQITKDGISPLAFPGNRNAVIKATSYEHDEQGIAVEDEKSIKKMQEKRMRKYKLLKREIFKIKTVNVYGKKDSSTALIVWGSVKGAAIEAAKDLKIKVIQPKLINPFPEKEFKKHLKGVNRIIVAELNSLNQLSFLLNRYGIIVDKNIQKYTGRPLTKQELIKKINE